MKSTTECRIEGRDRGTAGRRHDGRAAERRRADGRLRAAAGSLNLAGLDRNGGHGVSGPWALSTRGSRALRIARFNDRYTAAMECLERDLEECVTHLRFPEDHHQRIRTTNRLERLNGESRRRTKVIPRFPSERSCLTLLYASLRTASKHWRGIPMTAPILRQLQTASVDHDSDQEGGRSRRLTARGGCPTSSSYRKNGT
jgi:hypothetical protein